jgi:hypothetical protein
VFQRKGVPGWGNGMGKDEVLGIRENLRVLQELGAWRATERDG